MDSTLCHVTRPHDQVYAIITRSRFGHKLPINSQKVGDKSVQKKTRDDNNKAPDTNSEMRDKPRKKQHCEIYRQSADTNIVFAF